MKNIKEKILKISGFIKEDIWRIRLTDLSRKKSFFIKQLRIILLTLKGFDEDKCQIRASSLTFYSLLSVVPVIAMIFGIAKGFGFEKMLERQISGMLEGQEEIVEQILAFSHSMLESTKGGLIAGIGLIVLFWSVMKVLGNIEEAFNEIWEIKKPRTLGRKLSDYLSIMLIGPIIIILSSSVTVFITGQITQITQNISFLAYFGPIIFFFIKLLPYCLIWLLFTFLYMLMPNTKVNFRSALIAGIIAGTIFQATEWAYFSFQIGVAKYNAIYGSFAALPMFLIWMNISWLIVLFGAELSFANQNVDRYEFEADSLEISYSFKKLLSLLIANLVIKNFDKGEKPMTASEISNTLELPIRLVRSIIYEFVECKIFSEIKTESDKEVALQPARSIDSLSVNYILKTIEQRGTNSIPVAQTNEFKILSETMLTFKDTIENSSANKLLKDI